MSSQPEASHDAQQKDLNTAFLNPLNVPSYPQAMQYPSPTYLQPGYLQYPEAPVLSEDHAAVSSPLDFTVDQLTAPRASAAFAHEDAVSTENQPGKNSLSE